MKPIIKHNNQKQGLSLIEVIVAAAILGVGLLSIVRIFPYGIEASRRSEDLTQATLLANTIFEGLKSDPINFPAIPGSPDLIIPLPGNSYDDDTNDAMFDQTRTRGRRAPGDFNANGIPDADFDGMPERDGSPYFVGQPNGLDDDGDGVIDDSGDSGSKDLSTVPRSFALFAPDGDYNYDPELNIDEEFADGIDNDRDGLIDEDTRLPSVRIGRSNFMLPMLAGDGVDNDGDGEDNDNNPDTPAVADGIDNDGDDEGKIDNGIDEEIWDGRDNDGDGLIDEDCQLAAFPFMGSKFAPPYNRYNWQIRVGSVPDNGNYGLEDINGDGVPDLGDGIDNDGDGLVDEELPDGLDFDFPVAANSRGLNLQAYTRRPSSDGLVDEDCISGTLPNWRRIEIIITWGGDGIDNDEDMKGTNPNFNDRRQNRETVSYGGITWGIDEEREDGIDNDFDGLIDEDTYKFEFKLVGFINLEDPSESFTYNSGQPRGIAPSELSYR
jgi:prepilin-type N-terminal cleavage/methylation domain-containing protein